MHLAKELLFATDGWHWHLGKHFWRPGPSRERGSFGDLGHLPQQALLATGGTSPASQFANRASFWRGAPGRKDSLSREGAPVAKRASSARCLPVAKRSCSAVPRSWFATAGSSLKTLLARLMKPRFKRVCLRPVAPLVKEAVLAK
ncbi:hypothetical protein PGT21_006969 [Puccinia graminis f. sp. tritici]|uniref:Uncharacterized protein n=2 Tax=Puccinia graminis f. sp. tritici TaxID=56615 RepID=E3KA25_PUCGT|nr:uncharacterized protein PGTG_07259 [Puccinia graminis f. sp. tritici CRL 75-36-700-3]EFP81007.2 hypothetical protein PGTG_07259 [Puccinia graminis f. sp. tritici CRL 75-36-700-3]KAA1068952.1 hypothetical protein PGT21_006969 [Puccinia graminis f. sp. tritici]